MGELRVQYLLVGGGVAADAAARAIRSADADGSVLLVGREINRPYDRRAVNKAYLRREVSRGDVTIEPLGWYADRRIELRTGRRATAIEVGRRRVTFDSGETVGYEKLLLATGAAAAPLAVPGGGLPGCYPLWTLEDADRLRRAVEVARGEAGSRRPARVVVAGGGPNAGETAASLAATGVAVDWVAGRRGPMGAVAGEAIQSLIVRRAEAAGVAVHVGRVVQVEGDGRAQRAVVAPAMGDERTLPCDLLTYAVGMVVPRDLLRGTAIAAETAVLCDATGRTSVPGVFAAGDGSAWLDRRFGRHRVVSHWDHAEATGRVAGVTMAGGEAALPPDGGYRVELPGLSLHAWGDGRRVVRRVVRGEGGNLVELGAEADGRVSHVLAAGDAADRAGLGRLVDERTDVDEVALELT